jgi:hypothetical protein
MQSGLSAEEQYRRKQEALRELARQLAPKSPYRSAGIGPWTLRHTDDLETESLRRQVRVERLEAKPVGSIRPRFPHQGPPPTPDEMRSFLRRAGWDQTPDVL